MVSVNPFAEFREECETALREALVKSYPQISIHKFKLESPPSPEFGELASSLCFERAKETGEKPVEMAENVVQSMKASQFALIQSLEAAGKGYINFHVDLPKLSKLT